jgi:hypothetical protein
MVKRELYRGATVSVGMLSRVLLIVHGRVAPSSEDWVHVCAHIQNNLHTARGLMVTTKGAAPNAAQRKAGLDLLPKNYSPPPAAIMTDALLVRGAITALNWFLNDTHRAFHPDDLVGAAKHLKITEEEAADLIALSVEIAPGKPT